ncbi:MAG: c-type cytochrome [Pseudotabrizicola sp.]|uniref:c-type cytochrome n=1 Tax=Pseudotabrizicola sp. TaxID=2939647 RepID=UPI00272767AB|nr:c-type cytochrome [Pseudotabrizicola sp.]MDO8883602.1 c-type cytochrome [Pseudotabrizicola sp.]MDP2081255.1 c-type cytochrome [Pseudotabrizicola sp.]MDZ7576126.1 c-type cytochrome [Pseudotabrizicola sp.]
MIRQIFLALTLAAATALPVAAERIGDAARGATLFDRQCKACHQIGDGATNRVGPTLSNIFGRKAGTVAGFKYSKSITRMGADGLTWTLQTLDAYIENPKALVSGTRMNYRGMADASARADLMAFLRDYSDQPANIPESEPTARKSEPTLDPAILAIQGDPEYGAYLSSECSTCHRRDGADEGIPAITQWPPEDFVVAMHAYKSKLRPHPVMQMMASRLSNDEIAALAAYFATLE